MIYAIRSSNNDAPTKTFRSYQLLIGCLLYLWAHLDLNIWSKTEKRPLPNCTQSILYVTTFNCLERFSFFVVFPPSDESMKKNAITAVR